jgi:hypothetical protein
LRKTVLNIALSLDGYIAGPKGEFDWLFTDQDYGLKEFFSRVDTTLIGRGIPLFRESGGRRDFKWLGCKTYSSGLVQLHYA